MKKVLIILAVFAFTLNITGAAAQTAETKEQIPETVAYILTESSTGTVLSESRADERMPPASLTKIMLLLITADEINAGRLAFTDTVTVSANASGMVGSVIWLEPGEKMSVADIVKSIVIASANDAAVALAEHIAGNEQNFVKLMNQKAMVLGMNNTNFVNSAGYDNPNHYTTARDAAIMSQALMRDKNYALFSEYMLTRLSSVRTGTDKETQLLNTNKLINYYKGIEGIKTGTTDNAGYCLSAAATRGDMRLISVVMGCNTDDERMDFSEQLLDYGFGNFELCRDLGQNLPPLNNLPVTGGVSGEVKISQMQKDVVMVIPKGRAGDIKYEIYLPEKVTAPIAQNQPVGTITAKLDGKVVYESYIISDSAAHKLTFSKVFTALLKGLVS